MAERDPWLTGMIRGAVQSIQIGRVQTRDAIAEGAAPARPWTSAIVKRGVTGPVEVGTLGIAGDEQADLKHHGGPDKAVLAYAASHYAAWGSELPEKRLGAGAFGENLTVTEVDESLSCIGDVVRIGGVLLQVTQPRQPCWKLSRLWNIPQFALRVQQLGRTGWYFRVLEAGTLAPGDELTLVDRLHPEFTVAYAHAVMHGRPHVREVDLALAACPALAASWRSTLTRRAGGEELPSPLRRLEGEAAG
jgi:MOSC domain-containing protein YiiM